MQPKKRPSYLPDFLSKHFSQDPLLLPLLGGAAILLLLCMLGGVFLSFNLFFDGGDLSPLPSNSPTATASSLEFATTTAPVVPTWTPFPTPIQTSTFPTTTPAQPNASFDPINFIREYYTTINAGRYQITWSMLSNNFKGRNHCCNPDGSYRFEPYANYWDSVARVEILSIQITQQTRTSASVSALLRYHYENENVVDDSHMFILVKEEPGESWQIDEVR